MFFSGNDCIFYSLSVSQEPVVLHSYNAHNQYVMQLRAFNSLHDEYYTKQIYDMLDELQVNNHCLFVS